MSLSFMAPGASLEIRWIVYALLRDNIQHHLEGGSPSPQFEGIHGISRAVGGPSIELPAAKFHDELTAVEHQLMSLPVSQLAITGHTRSIIYLKWPDVGGIATEVVGPLPIFEELVRGASTLGDVFGSTVATLRSLADKAGADGSVLVSDS